MRFSGKLFHAGRIRDSNGATSSAKGRGVGDYLFGLSTANYLFLIGCPIAPASQCHDCRFRISDCYRLFKKVGCGDLFPGTVGRRPEDIRSERLRICQLTAASQPKFPPLRQSYQKRDLTRSVCDYDGVAGLPSRNSVPRSYRP